MRRLILLAAVAFLMRPGASFAQLPSPLVRADLAIGTGVLGTSHAEASRYDRWAHSGFAGVDAGIFWTDHFKTEAGVLWSATAETYASEPPDPSGAYVMRLRLFQNRVFFAGHTYQFGRNAVVHPFVTAGVSVDRERTSLERPEQTVYYPQGRTARLPAEISHTDTRIRVRPYAATGVKAYFSERGFFRTDVKVDVREDNNQVTWKAAIGLDF